MYSAITFTCGQAGVVSYTATEQTGLTGINDDGAAPTTIFGTIDTVNGQLTFNFSRGTYTSSFSGPIAKTGAGTYSFSGLPEAGSFSTGSVENAAGTFGNVPNC